MYHIVKNTALFLFVLLAFAPSRSGAQEIAGDHEVSLSYGRMSGTEVLKMFRERRPKPDVPTYRKEHSSTGNIFATYRYNIRKNVSLGVALGTESFSYDRFSNPAYASPVFIARYHVNVTTLAIESRFIYYNSKVVRMYGLLGIGGRFYHERSLPKQEFDGTPSTKAFFNSQISPLGLSFGNRFKGFVEIGFGYKGMMNFGCAYRIRKIAPKPVEVAP